MKVLKNKRFLKIKRASVYLLYICVNYLACASSEGMEKNDFRLDSSKRNVAYLNEPENKKSAGNVDNIMHTGKEENNPVYNKGGVEPLGSLYQLSKSEMFSFKAVLKVNENTTKLNRRVNDKQLIQLEELRNNNFNFTEALSIINK